MPRHTSACMSDVDYTQDARLAVHDLIYLFIQPFCGWLLFFCHGRKVLTNYQVVYHTLSPTMPLYISWKGCRVFMWDDGKEVTN